MQCDWKGEAVGMREMRKHLAWYLRGLPGAARLRNQAQELTTFSQLEALLRAEGIHPAGGLDDPTDQTADRTPPGSGMDTDD
jgi:hypothetical protein